jgi:hypothetical protein
MAGMPLGRMLKVRALETALRTGETFERAADCARVSVSTAKTWAAWLGIRKGDLLAETPEARIDAVILANFSDSQNDPESVSAWLAFWSEARKTPALWRIQKINERRLLSNLRHAFKQLLPEDEARMAAAGLAAMIEGLWLRCALTSGPRHRPRLRRAASAEGLTPQP